MYSQIKGFIADFDLKTKQNNLWFVAVNAVFLTAEGDQYQITQGVLSI